MSDLSDSTTAPPESAPAASEPYVYTEIVRNDLQIEKYRPVVGVLTKLVDYQYLFQVFVRMKGKLAPNSLLLYDGYGRKFCTYMMGRPITPQIILGWTKSLQDSKTLGPYKINHTNITIKAFLRWLHKFEYCPRDYADCITLLQVPAAKLPKTFTEEEYNKIKAWCTGRRWCQPHLWLIILAYRTGMSLIDCCHLRWRNIRLASNGPSFIDIYRIKTERLGEKALCTIPIIPNTDVHEWLMKLKAVEHLNYKRFDGITDYVHQDCPGKYLDTKSRLRGDFWNIFLKAGLDPGLYANKRERKTFKNFRNTFISNLVNSGVQLALIMKMTGHNDAKMILKYLKPDRGALQDGLAKAFGYAMAQSGEVGKSGLVVEVKDMEPSGEDSNE